MFLKGRGILDSGTCDQKRLAKIYWGVGISERHDIKHPNPKTLTLKQVRRRAVIIKGGERGEERGLGFGMWGVNPNPNPGMSGV